MQQPEEKDLNKMIENKFYCSKKFAVEIEDIVKNNNMSYIDSIVFFCEKNSLDVEVIPKLMSKPLKEKLKAEAMELNFLKKTSYAKLPV